MSIRICANYKDARSASLILYKSWQLGYKEIIDSETLGKIQEDQWINILLENYKHKSFETAILNKEGVDIGVAVYGPLNDEKRVGWGEITAFYFLPEAWGKYGPSELIAFTKKRLLELGYSRICLWVLKENLRAQNFYQKNDFVPSHNSKLVSIGTEDYLTVEFVLEK